MLTESPLHRADDGRWTLLRPLRSAHPSYSDGVLRYLNSLDPLFSRAKSACEFEFILSLLRVSGVKGPGWDPLETVEEALRCFTVIKRRLRDQRHVAHQALVLYGLVIEASEPYEVLANLMHVMEGGRWHHTNFPDQVYADGRRRPLHPKEKIEQLKSRGKRLRLELDFFDEFVDNGLRNAVFHSDYSIHWPWVRVCSESRQIDFDEWMMLVNRSQAYLEAFLGLLQYHVAAYGMPAVIPVHPEFSPNPDEKAVVIVRQNHGVVALKDNWSKAELAGGAIPFTIGKFLPYEPRLIAEGRLLLPSNRIERVNRILRVLPKPVARTVVRHIRNYFDT
jgi:hypothetical protein